MIQNIILIFISIFVLFFSIEDFGNLFLSIPFFLILSHNLSDLSLRIIVTKEKKILKDKNFELICLIGIVSVLFGINSFEQTIGGYELFWKLSFFSLIISVLCVLILSKFYSFKNEKRFYNILSLSICFYLLIPNIGICVNKYFSREKDEKQEIVINYRAINPQARGSDTFEIFIRTEYDKNERLDVKKKFYESITDNQNVLLTLNKGILGYDYVKKIEKVEK